MDNAVLIRKVLMNEASEEERRELNAWIASHPDHAEEFEDMKLFYEEHPGEKEMEHNEEFYEPLKKIQASIKRVKHKERQIRFYKTAGISTAVSCLIFTAAVYFFNSKIAPDNHAGRLSGITLSAAFKFKDTPLGTVLQAIGEKNHVVFTTAAEELLVCTFTGTFCKGAAIEDVMDVLAESENFQYTFNVNSIVLTGKGCSR